MAASDFCKIKKELSCRHFDGDDMISAVDQFLDPRRRRRNTHFVDYVCKCRQGPMLKSKYARFSKIDYFDLKLINQLSYVGMNSLYINTVSSSFSKSLSIFWY